MSRLSAIFLMLTLAFLTVSLPFVYEGRQLIEVDSPSTSLNDGECDEETDNPFANTTEEKPASNISAGSEEYLHETHSEEQYLAALSSEYLTQDVSVYNAFIGELISPPPDLA